LEFRRWRRKLEVARRILQSVDPTTLTPAERHRLASVMAAAACMLVQGICDRILADAALIRAAQARVPQLYPRPVSGYTALQETQ
jgi:hypothetical protein